MTALIFEPPAYTVAPATQVVGGELDEATIDLLLASGTPRWCATCQDDDNAAYTPGLVDTPVSSWERDQ